MQDINAVIHNLLGVRETFDAIGAQWIDDAIAALREKEPIKPVIHIVQMMGNYASQCYECGACGKPISPGDKYCRECGRPVKWDG